MKTNRCCDATCWYQFSNYRAVGAWGDGRVHITGAACHVDTYHCRNLTGLHVLNWIDRVVIYVSLRLIGHMCYNISSLLGPAQTPPSVPMCTYLVSTAPRYSLFVGSATHPLNWARVLWDHSGCWGHLQPVSPRPYLHTYLLGTL